MARYCASTVTPVKAVRRPNEQWTVDGFGGQRYVQGLQFVFQLLHPYNVSFYTTSGPRECIDRLSSNQSDISNVYIPISSIAPEYSVPEVFFTSKVQFITGYNVSENPVAGKETATALGNVRLLETRVYLFSLLLTLAFVGLIIARICICYKLLTPRSKVRAIRRELNSMFYYSSERFKLVSFLFCTLCFYIVTSFLCLYKTSQVVIEKPFYPKSYQESLGCGTSLSFVFDLFSPALSTCVEYERPPSSPPAQSRSIDAQR